MVNEPGLYAYVTERGGGGGSGGSDHTCDTYIIGAPDQLVRIEFHQFHVSCKREGMISVIDGWAIGSDFFPSIYDEDLSFEKRYLVYCGKYAPRHAVTSSQNVAHIQSHIPLAEQGWLMRVTFLPNTKPCNVVTEDASGVYTLQNFGRRIRCSLSILYPVKITFTDIHVGVERARGLRKQFGETGVIRQCSKLGFTDLVQLRGGEGIEPRYMRVFNESCGVDSAPKPEVMYLPCDHSVVTLVSSGRYANRVSFTYTSLLPQLSEHQRQLLRPFCVSPPDTLLPDER